jgi:phosphonate transport system ATP-binding protein
VLNRSHTLTSATAATSLTSLTSLTSSASLLLLDHATVRYGDNTVLRNVELNIGSGECVALVGPSGAGKSTLIGVCNGTVGLANGAAYFAGEPISDTDEWRKRGGRKIATIYQQLHLSGRLKVVHNVNAGKLGEWSSGKALRSLVRPCEVSEVTAVLEKLGIADKVRMRTDLLSGGEQQRVAIARALRQEPLLILADEPTAALDPARADEVMGLLTRVAREAGHGLIVSQHDASLAQRYCDRIVGLRGGIVAFDTSSERTTSEMLSALYEIDPASSKSFPVPAMSASQQTRS